MKSTVLRPTLRRVMLLLALGGIAISAIVLTVIGYQSSKKSLLNFSNEIIEKSAGVVREQVVGFFGPTSSMAKLALQLIQNDLISMSDEKIIEEYFFNFLQVHKNVSMLYLGSPEGDYLMLQRKKDGSLSTKKIDRGPGYIETAKWTHRKVGGGFHEIDSIVEKKDSYDPRKRPWYNGALAKGSLYWTDIYIFYTTKEPGTTAATPIFDKNGKLRGVLALDVALGDLSNFLKNYIKVGESGHAFIVDTHGDLIATKDVESLLYREDNGKERLRKLKESIRPELEKLAELKEYQDFFHLLFSQNITVPKPITVRYLVGEEYYLARLVPIVATGKTKWLTGVVAKEDEFLSSAKENNRNAAIIAILFLLLAFGFVYMISKPVTASMENLVKESDNIKNLDLNNDLPPTQFDDIQKVYSAVNSMKGGLKAFQKYVPLNLVRRLIKLQIEPKLGGVHRELTIFFSDIQDFTTFSENMDPDELSKKMGKIFTIAANNILETEGTVDKYIGDAVMAFWGAPVPVEDHPVKAVLASLKIQEDLSRDDIGKEMHMRIGLHTAEVVVGNFGSENRYNYTVLGDGVNVASRLEGVNKYFGTGVMITEETFEKVKDQVICQRMAKVRVKGRKQPLNIYKPIGKIGEVDQGTLGHREAYEAALNEFEGGDFFKAKEMFSKLQDDKDAIDFLFTTIMVPGSNWDGVIDISNK